MKINQTLLTQLNSVGSSVEGASFFYPKDQENDMNIQNQFKIKILNELNPNRILEIGTHKAHFCYLVKEILPNAKITTFGIDEWSQNAVDILNKYYGNNDIDFILGDSKVTVPHFIKESKNIIFELAWVDGGHSYECAINDLINCSKLNIKNIMVDDFNISSVKQAVNEFIKESSYVIKEISTDIRKVCFLVKV